MAVRLTPYVVMNGNGQEALSFYKKALDAKIVGVQKYGDMPADPNMPLPEEAKDRIAHALLKIGEAELMLSDGFPGSPYQTGNHLGITISTQDADTAKRVFTALAAGGRVTMPLQETFWSPAYGSLTDRFGVMWHINTEGQMKG